LANYFNELAGFKPDELSKIEKAAYEISSEILVESSIDNYLDGRKDDPYVIKVGKMLIAYVISCYEDHFNPFSATNKTMIPAIFDTWYFKCYQRILETCQESDILARLNEITFIIFNYDRFFEYLFCHALINKYHMTKDKAQEIVKQINIIHPYGTVGEFFYRSFGDSIDGVFSPSIQENIHTFTEYHSIDNEDREKISRACGEAERMIFLGFAYHPQNMKLLFPTSSDKTLRAFGTAFGLSDVDINALKYKFSRHNYQHGSLNFVDKKCSEFFDHFQIALHFNE
jgi:hypothetical protein